MANDRQILNENLIATLVNEAMGRKSGGISELFNVHGCQLAMDYLWARGVRRLFFRFFALLTTRTE